MSESFQFSDDKINTLRFVEGPLSEAMQWIYSKYGPENAEEIFQIWADNLNCKNYGNLKKHEDAIRKYVKIHFCELKEKQIKDLFDRKLWLNQLELLLKAKKLQQIIGNKQHNDMNDFEKIMASACKKSNVELDAKEKKRIKSAVSWKNPNAEKVIKKIHKGKPNSIYGLFLVGNEVVEYETDSDLRDTENVNLDPLKSVNYINETYFLKEVLPHVPDAWIDASTKDKKDGEIGIVGYEIPFNRHFYQYQPPRDLAEIDIDLDRISFEIVTLLEEVHS